MIGPLPVRGALVLARQHDEARGVVRLVLDVLGEDVEPVDFGGEPRRDRAARLVAALGDLARGAGRVGGDDRLDSELADDVAALAERHDVALDRLDAVERRALRRHQLMADRQEPFGDDVQAGGRHQVMDVGDAAGDRILDRDHAELGLARRRSPRARPRRSGRAAARSPDRPRGRRCGNWRPARPGTRSSCGCVMAFRYALQRRKSTSGASSARARLEVLRRVDAERHASRRSATSMRMPASSARNCSSRSRCSSGEGGSATKRSSAARR